MYLDKIAVLELIILSQVLPLEFSMVMTACHVT